MSTLLISGQELTFLARQRYPFAYIRTLDKDYNVPTEEAIKTFNKELARELFEKYGDKWQEYFDCENFTFEAVTLAYRKHFISRQAGIGNAQGVAIGILCFNIIPSDSNSGHCLGVRLDGNRTFSEFEPQNRLVYPLTSDQCQSVSLCLFF